jgi:hypothetical protein
MSNFGVYFWALLMASIVLGGFQVKADCPDCGTHPYYGGK